jgi:hypothetical protein
MSQVDNRDSHSKDNQEQRRRKENRTWSGIAKLAEEALAAFDAGKPKDARERMKAIYGMAMNADQDGL